MDGWIDGWMDGWIDGWIWINGKEWMNGLVERLINEMLLCLNEKRLDANKSQMSTK